MKIFTTEVSRKLPLHFWTHPDLDANLGFLKDLLPLCDKGNTAHFADNLKSCGQIFRPMKFLKGGNVSLAKTFDFGDDPDYDPDPGILAEFSPLYTTGPNQWCLLPTPRIATTMLNGDELPYGGLHCPSALLIMPPPHWAEALSDDARIPSALRVPPQDFSCGPSQ